MIIHRVWENMVPSVPIPPSFPGGTVYSLGLKALCAELFPQYAGAAKPLFLSHHKAYSDRKMI